MRANVGQFKREGPSNLGLMYAGRLEIRHSQTVKMAGRVEKSNNSIMVILAGAKMIKCLFTSGKVQLVGTWGKGREEVPPALISHRESLDDYVIIRCLTGLYLLCQVGQCLRRRQVLAESIFQNICIFNDPKYGLVIKFSETIYYANSQIRVLGSSNAHLKVSPPLRANLYNNFPHFRDNKSCKIALLPDCL